MPTNFFVPFLFRILFHSSFISNSCLTKEGEIDWDRIKQTIDDYGRSDEQRIDAVRQCAKHDGDLQTPRIWCPQYGTFTPNNDINQLLLLILLIY